MAAHRFKVGQVVIYHPPRRTIGASRFKVLKLMPPEGQEFTYRIKSADENVERVARESELTCSP